MGHDINAKRLEDEVPGSLGERNVGKLLGEAAHGKNLLSH